jgi:hypothetical protein
VQVLQDSVDVLKLSGSKFTGQRGYAAFEEKIAKVLTVRVAV